MKPSFIGSHILKTIHCHLCLTPDVFDSSGFETTVANHNVLKSVKKGQLVVAFKKCDLILIQGTDLALSVQLCKYAKERKPS